MQATAPPLIIGKLISTSNQLIKKGAIKMKKTENVFILDKSRSMSGLEDDTIGGYNAMLDKQEKEEGEAIVTTVLFDNNYEIIHD